MSNLVPDGWGYKCLSDIAKVDGDNLKTSTAPDYKFKYIDIASVSTGQINIPSETVEFENSPSRARKRIKKGDVLMATVRPNLQAFASFDEEGNDFIASTGFAVVRAKNGNSGRFILNTILSDYITRQIDALVVGSNYPAINSSDVKNLEILTPPFPEQQKIAKILTSVDEVIEKTQAQIDKLKDLKTGMMQELLTNGIGHTEFKDSPVGRIPAEWTYSELGKLVTFSQGVQVDLELQKTEFFEGGVPFLRIENYTQNSKDLRYIDASSARDKYTKKEDVVMVRYGATAGFVGRGAEGVLANNLFQVKPNNTLLTKDFLHLFLLQSFEKLQMMMAGGAMPALNFSMVSGLSLALPPIKEQQDIANAIYSIDKLGEATRKKLKHIQNTKKALMQDLLTGKVRVNV